MLDICLYSLFYLTCTGSSVTLLQEVNNLSTTLIQNEAELRKVDKEVYNRVYLAVLHECTMYMYD